MKTGSPAQHPTFKQCLFAGELSQIWSFFETGLPLSIFTIMNLIVNLSLAHLKMDDWSFQKGKEEKQFIETLKQFNSVSQTFVLFR